MTPILILLALTQKSSSPKVFELIEPSETVVIQAYVKAPELTARDRAAWFVLGRSLLKGTWDFTAQKLRDYGSQAGTKPEVVVMPDFMRIQVVVPNDALSLGGDLVLSLLNRPSLTDEDVTAAIDEAKDDRRPPWIEAIDPYNKDFDKLSVNDVRILWTRAFQPSNLSFVVGGRIKQGEGTAEIAKRMAQWKPQRVVRARADIPPRPLVATGSSVSIHYLSGAPFSFSTPNTAARLLAVFALGVGKDATLWREVRERLALSYLQFVLLWPTVEGWVPTFVVARSAEGGEKEGSVSTTIRDALITDIDHWNEESLLRAQAMAEAAFVRNLSSSPIWLDSDGPMTGSLVDRCAWRGYLELVGSGTLDEKTLLSAMTNVDVEQLKVAAKSLLDECRVGWIPGTPTR